MTFADNERRRRIAIRHHLERTAGDCVAAVRSVAAFHSTDPVTPYLGMWARIHGFETHHLDRSLWDDRSLWRMHAMRRTLFLVPLDDAGVFLAGASRDIARKERARLEGWLAEQMPPHEIGPWLEDLMERVLEVTGGGGEWRTQDLTAEIPELGHKIRVGSGKWTAETPVSSRLLFLLAMEGRLVRTRPAGSWRSSQYRWAAASQWWEEPPAAGEDEDEARAGVLVRYLATHGPVTMTDIRWWTGWTVRNIRRALEKTDVTTVALESGGEGLILADDLEAVDAPESPSVALLPGLDPTPMGWKERDWYLGPHGERLFDTNGNAGPTVWADGRMVGGWGQRSDGTVVYRLLEEVDAATGLRIDQEAAELTKWLDGQVISARFPTPVQRELAGG